MTIYGTSKEPDTGLFYVRVWWDHRPPLETSYTSLREAIAAVDALHAERAYTRMEFLQAREWATRRVTEWPLPTEQEDAK